MPTITAVGEVRPRAQGQAQSRIAMTLSIEVDAVCPARKYQAPVELAIAKITPTNHPVTKSTSSCVVDFLKLASSISFKIC